MMKVVNIYNMAYRDCIFIRFRKSLIFDMGRCFKYRFRFFSCLNIH